MFFVGFSTNLSDGPSKILTGFREKVIFNDRKNRKIKYTSFDRQFFIVYHSINLFFYSLSELQMEFFERSEILKNCITFVNYNTLFLGTIQTLTETKILNALR